MVRLNDIEVEGILSNFCYLKLKLEVTKVTAIFSLVMNTDDDDDTTKC